MRNRKQKDGITVNAIAGTHVVFLGLDLEQTFKSGFRGFAIKRKDDSEGETIWLRGLKTFEETEPNPAMGENFSTQKHPIQGFQWADYSVSPGINYSYTIYCMYGEPSDLDAKREIQVSVTTEVATGPTHSVFFNRGSVATQEYARRFLNKKPNEAGQGAFEWLSRGLLEALIAYIDGAKSGQSIHGAVYEFQYPDVLNALNRASERGVNVKMIFDDVEQYDSDGTPKGPWKKNREAIANAKIKPLCRSRKNAKLMHNKFFVLSNGTKNISVWTGSTNITENGIFGHSNLGHIVVDESVADSFMAYWERLNDDPAIAADYRNDNMTESPIPDDLETGTTTIFSPRGTQLDSLDWYSKIAGEANDALFMTFAFGMHEKFKEVYRSEDSKLRMALMEKAYSNPKVKEKDEQDIQEIRNLPNVVVSLGNRIVTNSFDRWLWELRNPYAKNVFWIHTKYMIVDPLGKEPIVVSGSANFSKASTDTNDENMLVIKGDKRIADIYFGEYIRLFSHYSFREVVKWAKEKEENNQPQNWKPQYLDNSDKWMKDYYQEGDKGARCSRRKYFSGPMSL